jgi:hypothetical protein
LQKTLAQAGFLLAGSGASAGSLGPSIAEIVALAACGFAPPNRRHFSLGSSSAARLCRAAGRGRLRFCLRRVVPSSDFTGDPDTAGRRLVRRYRRADPQVAGRRPISSHDAASATAWRCHG